jgi:sRNA-binding carbon storage regulator CsrA
VRGNRLRLGFDCPPDVHVVRGELNRAPREECSKSRAQPSSSSPKATVLSR